MITNIRVYLPSFEAQDKVVGHLARGRLASPSLVAQVALDSGMVVVIFICIGFVFIVIALLFFVKNEWCDILFRNMTVRYLWNSIWISH